MKKVLIVDDRPENLAILKGVLSAHNYSVIEAENGREALNKAINVNSQLDLIISDIIMPVMDGYTLCRKWMVHKNLVKIPFVFITANYTDGQDAQLALKLGAKKFLTRPVDNDVLIREINDVMQNHEFSPIVDATTRIKSSKQFYEEYNQRLAIKLEDKLQHVERQNKELITKEIVLKDARQSLERRIKEREQAEDALRVSESRLRSILNNAFDSIITFNKECKIESINSAAETSFGYNNQEIIGKNIEKLVFGSHIQHFDNFLHDCIAENQSSTVDHLIEIECIRKDGSVFPVELALSETLIGDMKLFTAIIRDITQRKRSDAAIYHMAYHDSLTDLVNRNEFERRMSHALTSAKQRKLSHVLLYLDLDQFKIINDTCGHDAGDELLRQLSNLLYSKLRDRDTLARLGGDEFGILLENCPVDQAEQIAQLLLKEIKQFRFVSKNKSFTVGASIGLVSLNGNHQTVAQLMRSADAACYTAKDLGRNRIHVFSECDADQSKRHNELQWASKINKALEESRFTLYKQSIENLTSHDSTNTRCEFLLRMLSTSGAVIPTGAFIPAAERYNLMPALDRYVINKAFEHIVNYSSNSNDKTNLPVSFFINLSGSSLTGDTLYTYIEEQIANFAINPETICFEITETSAITNLKLALRFIEKVKKLGCRFALDDFGTGLSSFSYLKALPVDFLKIDGGFVSNMLHDKTDYAIVEAINQVAHVTGKQTIAEFVESEEIKQILTSIGVDFAQGYQIGEPQPIYRA